MDSELNNQIEMQKKISDIVKIRQEQITELKTFYDINNKKLYKEIILFGNNLLNFEEFISKGEYRLKCENIFSLALSIGRILDLSNSVKTLFIAIKIFENNEAVPLLENDFLKERFILNKDKNSSNLTLMNNFYDSLYKNDSNNFSDFTKYFAFQTDSKSKNNANFNYEDFTSILNKVTNSKHYKFYSRVKSSFVYDYPSIVITACDIFFMLYNKLMDKICYNYKLTMYIKKLDGLIVENFINSVSDDLQKLSEYILFKECDEIAKSLEKIYK